MKCVVTKKGRNYHLHRVVYVFEYNNELSGSLTDAFEAFLRQINSSYEDYKISGLLLYYDKYAISMVEGIEAILLIYFFHLRKSLIKLRMKRAAILYYHTHVKKLYMRGWCHVTVKSAELDDPPALDAKPEVAHQEIIDIGRKLNFLFKYIASCPDFNTKMSIEEWLKSEIPCEYSMQFALECGVLRKLDHFLDDLSRPRLFFAPYEMLWPLQNITPPLNVINSKFADDESVDEVYLEEVKADLMGLLKKDKEEEEKSAALDNTQHQR